jgi:hypothetical protein
MRTNEAELGLLGPSQQRPQAAVVRIMGLSCGGNRWQSCHSLGCPLEPTQVFSDKGQPQSHTLGRQDAQAAGLEATMNNGHDFLQNLSAHPVNCSPVMWGEFGGRPP